MKCLTRPQICPAAALQVLEQLASPGPCIAHRLVLPWCSGVPREVSISLFLNSHANAAAERDLLRRAFASFPIGGAARNQLPHDVERNTVEAGPFHQEGQESRLFPFVDLNGGVLNFGCGIDRLSWALANQSPLPPRAPVEVCMKGPCLLGFLHLCWGAAASSCLTSKAKRGTTSTWLDQIT